MKTVTSVTFWNDAIGKRISVTYSEINASGVIQADNQRVDRVVTKSADIKHLDAIAQMAQKIVDAEDTDKKGV